MKLAITTSLCCLILAGCVTKPVKTGDSLLQLKTATFPNLRQQSYAVVGGLVHLKANYQSSFSAKLSKPLSLGFYLGKISVTPKEVISQATIDGVVVFCTDSNTYIDPLTGPHAISCFQSSEQGKFNSVKAAPGMIWFTKKLTPPISYVSVEKVARSEGKPLKRELYYDGSQNQILLFTQKTYENSVDIATQSRPLITRIDSIPRKVDLNGIEINIISYTENSLTYSIEKPWE
jgi:hypothetical protein